MQSSNQLHIARPAMRVNGEKPHYSSRKASYLRNQPTLMINILFCNQ